MTDDLDTTHVDWLKADVLWEILDGLGYVKPRRFVVTMANPERVAELARAVDAIQAWKFGTVPT